MPMFEDIRKLNYKGQAQVCKTFHQYLTKHRISPLQRKVLTH